MFAIRATDRSDGNLPSTPRRVDITGTCVYRERRPGRSGDEAREDRVWTASRGRSDRGRTPEPGLAKGGAIERRSEILTVVPMTEL
jgi:hypothetical protein